ncbi:hypothetical protein ACVWWQ_001259 [Rhodanobacter sp. TND4EL1]
MTSLRIRHLDRWLLVIALILVTTIYSPGLSGSWLFDDCPNIVDNRGVQPTEVSVSSMVRAALSSPASDFKRPLASLSFAANYLGSGLHPYGWKLTNLIIHLLNGWLVFLLARSLLLTTMRRSTGDLAGATFGAICRQLPILDSSRFGRADGERIATEVGPTTAVAARFPDRGHTHAGIVAALIAAGWMLLPINLTGVLYVVQRMESMANLFVLLGLLGYVAGRRRMLAAISLSPARKGRFGWPSFSPYTRGTLLCLTSITLPTAIGMLAKETAVMLPLYGLLVEWTVFRWRKPGEQRVGRALPAVLHRDYPSTGPAGIARPTAMGGSRRDWRVIALFLVVMLLPMLIGLAWLLPGLLNPATWATRDFNLGTRLLSEARIVVDYVAWTLLPTPSALSFYHDDFVVSRGLLTPWATLASLLCLMTLIALMCWLRRRQPLAALGIALFLGCHLLTGTVLPLELIYEHRNYFASFGLLLAVVPLLAAPSRSNSPVRETDPSRTGCAPTTRAVGDESPASESTGRLPMALPRHALLAGLMLHWAALTAISAYAWGDPLRLAEELASRAPQSPRAQYELGRTYIIYSHYDPASPFTRLAYEPLEASAALPHSSILPEQALIFMNARMGLPLKDAWWNSMIAKLKAHPPGVQDESSLGALTQCARDRHCNLPADRMRQAFTVALSHPHPSARLFATYGDYAWNVLDEHDLGERMTQAAVKASPDEPAYQITLIRMLAAQGRKEEARVALQELEKFNVGGQLSRSLDELHALVDLP